MRVPHPAADRPKCLPAAEWGTRPGRGHAQRAGASVWGSSEAFRFSLAERYGFYVRAWLQSWGDE